MCDMIVPWKALNGMPMRTSQFTWGAEPKKWQLLVKIEGGHHHVFQRLWAPPRDGGLLQITGVGDIDGVKKLVGFGEELLLG